MRAHVVVIGGGIAGLAAAHALASAPDRPHVTLLEAGERLGGLIGTVAFAGTRVDMGPDAMLARAPGGIALCRELGLGDDLVAPAQGPAYVFSRGRLRALPAGLLAGLPAGPRALVRSRILSPAGIARAGMDLVLPGRAPEGDESIGALVRRRLGDQVLDRLIDPLLGGINAGRCDDLSVTAAAPYLAAAARADRSLVRGLRRTIPAPPPDAPPAPVFLTLRGGLAGLTEALAASLGDADVRLGESVTDLLPAAGGLRVALSSGELLDADGAVLAVPATAAAGILRAAVPGAAAELAQVRSASVAVVALAYPREQVSAPPGSGFVVARDESAAITACTWVTAKWPHLDAGPLAVLKCSLGRAGEGDVVGLSDDELVALAGRDLERIMGLGAAPHEALVVRHRDALPQYAVGHPELVDRAEAAVAGAVPRLELAGSAYRGVGLPSCIGSGRAAAERLLATLARADQTHMTDNQELTT